MSHTPAPWLVEPTEHGHVIAKDGKSLAVAWPESLDGTLFPAKANAALIAAAPDLLEALGELAEIIDNAVTCNGVDSRLIDSFTTQTARAAIEKATSHE